MRAVSRPRRRIAFPTLRCTIWLAAIGCSAWYAWQVVLTTVGQGGAFAPVRATPPADTLLRRTEKHGILTALKWWDVLAQKHHVPYSLDYGSLLGQVRDGEIIPHDTDTDVVIGADSLLTFERLVREGANGVLDQEHHPPLAAIRLAGDLNTVIILFRMNHMHDFDDVPRVDCSGRNTFGISVDACSFTGPVARAFHLYTMSYVDVFLSGCPYQKDHLLDWECSKSTRDCCYCPSPMVFLTSLLHHRLERCSLGGVDTFCPPRDVAIERMQGIYGPGWAFPDPKWTFTSDPNGLAGGQEEKQHNIKKKTRKAPEKKTRGADEREALRRHL